MKSLILTLIFSSSTTFAGNVLHQKLVSLPVSITEETVIISNLGYSEPMVKIIVPALADVTLLNHRNLGAGGPCLSTREADIPEDIIKNNPRNENVVFKIRLEKQVSLSADKTKCSVMLVETAEALIRGKNFLHQAFHSLPGRTAEDCR